MVTEDKNCYQIMYLYVCIWDNITINLSLFTWFSDSLFQPLFFFAVFFYIMGTVSKGSCHGGKELRRHWFDANVF